MGDRRCRKPCSNLGPEPSNALSREPTAGYSNAVLMTSTQAATDARKKRPFVTGALRTRRTAADSAASDFETPRYGLKRATSRVFRSMTDRGWRYRKRMGFLQSARGAVWDGLGSLRYFVPHLVGLSSEGNANYSSQSSSQSVISVRHRPDALTRGRQRRHRGGLTTNRTADRVETRRGKLRTNLDAASLDLATDS